MKRVMVFMYGLVSYAVFLAVLLYAIGFLGNFGVPKSIDSGAEGAVGVALAVNAGLLGVFAVQHSVMARKWFKAALTQVIPEAAERSTYVLFSSVALGLLFWGWQPMGGVVWDTSGQAMEPVMLAGYAAGLAIVLLSTFLINHFDLFGLRQVYLYLKGEPYTHLPFRTPFFYRYVRHPLYVGWLLTFWCAPVMTAAHLFFAVMTSAYIVIAIRLEEADLVAMHGEVYRKYQRKVPMLLPAVRPQMEVVRVPVMER